MGLLLYKSDEMFSATELIRKSKMIFDKIVNDEIDKAIILRDGKPGFLLMDFVKYEKIMSEYEALTRFVETQNIEDKPKPKKIKQNNIVDTSVLKPIELEPMEINKEEKLEIKPEIKPAFVTPPRPKAEPEILLNENNEDEDTIEDIVVDTTNINIQEETTETDIKDTENSDDEELKTALERLKTMNFDDEMRIVAEQKIRTRLDEARKERARILAEQENLEKEDLKEELELQVHIKEENKKKERELKEFWD